VLTKASSHRRMDGPANLTCLGSTSDISNLIVIR